MLSIEELRDLLTGDARSMPVKELEALRETLYEVANCAYESVCQRCDDDQGDGELVGHLHE